MIIKNKSLNPAKKTLEPATVGMMRAGIPQRKAAAMTGLKKPSISKNVSKRK